ncbi:MAG: YfiR family protein [Zoogloeaceae bacterium]|nr:YfiR family protein [Zoogloeaceae bacterium]
MTKLFALLPTLFALLTCLPAPWALGPAFAQSESSALEVDALKAAYVFNFLKYTTWPETLSPRSGALSICLLDVYPALAREMLALNDRSLAGRRVVVRNVAMKEAEAAACHLTVVGADRVTQALAALAGGNSLLVSDAPDFVRRGGMIGLFVTDGRLKFEINPASLSNTAFTLDSRLLGLAQKSRREP